VIRRAKLRVALAGAALATLAGATPATAQVPAVPPYQGVYQPQGVDERGVWMEADEHERLLRDSNLLIRDPALNDYVKGVLCRTVGDDRCRNVRIYILRVPFFGAGMYANGAMEVNSGLLLRSRSEGELAWVLAHEFAHFEQRHTLRQFRVDRTASDIAAWVSLVAATMNTQTNINIVTFSARRRFSRDQERQADILGLGYIRRGAYRPQVAAEVWNRRMNEVDATAAGRGLRIQRYERTPFFATHPTNLERATYLMTLAGADLPDRNDGAESYASVMRPWLAQFVDDQVKLNDFDGSEYLLGELANGHWTADLLYWRGELYRMRGNPRDLVNAADFYRQSIALDASRPEAHRGLGLALLRAQLVEEGRQALARYLTLKPDASDAPMIRMLAGQGT
jgi:predicted Zn-dependent protease